ncbi:MAG TPA: [Fe-Fe] hydrogenase large subunit C-terminal domain-containing protein [Bacillota bacterium]|nr:[Fe-Fe] hydrogenase large subunit C-terminal domain-containing protein [Bacillota bacterium]
MKETIYINEELCQGCNKCIRNCPVFGANINYEINGQSKVRINQERCIRCGHCIQVCDHHARNYHDDTESFFKDLKLNEDITVIAAPSIRVNFPEFQHLLGYLKTCGVKKIYDVSFGADITVWAYLKTIREKGMQSMIAQPCPAIVKYIKLYRKELLPYLAPVQSPMICTAIYLRDYLKIGGKIAFLSPCIGKSDEIEDPETLQYVQYNVTYQKVVEYLKANGIHLYSYKKSDFDDIESGLGCLFSRPGGLRENVEAFQKDAWVRQIEGVDSAYPYLTEYSRRIATHKALPLLVDILNCPQGCNGGTGTCHNIDIDDSDFQFNQLKHAKLQRRGNLLSKKIQKLHRRFNRELKLSSFHRSYSSIDLPPLKEPNESELETIFMTLHKDAPSSREINCSACGYPTCREMAKAVFNQLERAADCIDFNRKEVQFEYQQLAEKNMKIQEMFEEVNQLSAQRLERAIQLTKQFSEITQAMQEIHQGNDEATQDIQNISFDITEVANMSNTLRTYMDQMSKSIEDFRKVTQHILDIGRRTHFLSINAGIEAARSKESGFTEISQEIRLLAEEARLSAISTESSEVSIHGLVEDILQMSNNLESKMNLINTGIINISATLEEFTAKGEEMIAAATNIVEENSVEKISAN